jgi:hypothetical protein
MPQQAPKIYDARTNPHFMWLIVNAAKTTMAGAPLIDAAAVLPLRQFAALQTTNPRLNYLINRARERVNANA